VAFGASPSAGFAATSSAGTAGVSESASKTLVGWVAGVGSMDFVAAGGDDE